MIEYKYIIYNNIKIYYKVGNFECYEPREDSFLLNDNIKLFASNRKVLDMGCGTGIQGLEAYKYSKDVTFCDLYLECIYLSKINFYINYINREADIEYIYKNIDKIILPVKFIISDLFSNINDKYDLIIFNPPYLPEVENEDNKIKRWISGGKEGYETILRFLRDAYKFLNVDGEILLIMSSISKPEYIIKNFSNIYNFTQISKVHYFFEDIILFNIKPKVYIDKTKIISK